MDTQNLVIRDDLASARENAWDRLASPGTWWTASERLAIAAETRRATGCALCHARKEALSPYTVDGAHDLAASLGAPELVTGLIAGIGGLLVPSPIRRKKKTPE